MAISDIYNSLTFGGVNSLDYGIYISGPGVFNAPVRDIEFVGVPGRNGAIEIDKGHWNNIEVTYKAGTFGDDQSDFAQKINAFRNAVVSQIGYQRITDTYNPEEYRLGIYASGLSVNPANRNSAGEFDLVFNCKPQRYLLSGEDEISVTSGDAITNPTLYEASPKFEIYGYGATRFNGYEFSIEFVPIGRIDLAPGNTITYLDNSDASITFNSDVFAEGDSIYFDTRQYYSVAVHFGITSITSYEELEFSDSNPEVDSSAGLMRYITMSFVKGTPKVVINTRTYTSPSYSGESATITTTIDYDGDGTITFSASKVSSPHIKLDGRLNVGWAYLVGDSTIPAIGNPTYIDCELGEAYMIRDGEVISLNSNIALGSNLPVLASGDNEITFDNTITDLKITPRWWEL